MGCWLAAPAAASPEPDARKELEQIALKLPYFVTGHFVYDSVPPSLERKRGEDYRQLVGRLATTKADVTQLIALLKHADPKVRTLAAAALFAREDPKVLPHLHALAGDTAETFATFGPEPATGYPESGPPLAKQTVAEVVDKLLYRYMWHAQCLGSLGGPDPFDDYWARRKDRAFCASWFAVRLERATQGTTSFPADRKAKIRAVRQQIDLLPRADRAWTLLWLYGPDLHDAFVTEAETVVACKELGPECLLAMLRHKVPSDDPDLQSRPTSNFEYKRMMGFVLRHAPELLRPGDADALLACEAWELDFQKHGVADPMDSPAWVVAAADLRPAKAKDLIREAFGRYRGEHKVRARSQLAVALWRLVGATEIDFLVEWFYAEWPERQTFPHATAAFLRETAPHRPKELRKLLTAIIADKRFDALDWQSLQTLAEVVNKLSDKPVVDPEALRAASHPFDLGSFHWRQAEAKAKYPKETAELLNRLAEWRSALREVATVWGP